MQAYRVSHKKSGRCYYVLATSDCEAIEKLTLHLGDAGGSSAWEAAPDKPAYNLVKGVILDEFGKPVKSVDA